MREATGSDRCIKCNNIIDGRYTNPPFIQITNDIYDTRKFFGKHIARYIKAKCSCGMEYIACLASSNNGYKVVDLLYQPVEFENMDKEFNAFNDVPEEKAEEPKEEKKVYSRDKINKANKYDLYELAKLNGFEKDFDNTTRYELKNFLLFKLGL